MNLVWARPWWTRLLEISHAFSQPAWLSSSVTNHNIPVFILLSFVTFSWLLFFSSFSSPNGVHGIDSRFLTIVSSMFAYMHCISCHSLFADYSWRCVQLRLLFICFIYIFIMLIYCVSLLLLALCVYIYSIFIFHFAHRSRPPAKNIQYLFA